MSVAAVLTAAISCGAQKSRDEEPAPRIAVILNETLTNEMSGDCEGLDKAVKEYLKKWQIRGASLSVMRNDSLVYSKGYGIADDGVPMTPGHILRVASVSKLITATGIMVLCERGMMSLHDRIFGEDGILCDPSFTAAAKDKRVFDITVEDLLRHKGGFTTGAGDPMFSTRDIIRNFNLDGPPDGQTLVRCVLSRRLGFDPGTSQKYSNFGYLLLSMAIEAVSGEAYEDFIQENVLHPAGCFDMHIACNTYEERRPNEVRYYMHAGSEPCEAYDLSGRMVERCYGGSDIRTLSGAGAWCASTAELCRFVAAIDGKPEIPDIVSAETVRKMTEYFDKDTFSLGWNDTKPDGEWTRTGTLAGTSALVKCYPDGECWIMVTNTGTYRGPYFSGYTSTLFRTCRENFSSSLPERDMFFYE